MLTVQCKTVVLLISILDGVRKHTSYYSICRKHPVPSYSYLEFNMPIQMSQIKVKEAEKQQ